MYLPSSKKKLVNKKEKQPKRATQVVSSGSLERLSGAGGVASIRQLYNKAKSPTTPKSQKANAYADVVEALSAYEGEKPIYLKSSLK